MPFCPQCGVANPDSARFCDQCGAQLIPVPSKPASPSVQPVTPAGQVTGAPVSAGPSSCPQCGAGVIPGEAFCDNCGAPLLNYSRTAPPVAPDLPFPGAPPQPVYPPPQPATIQAGTPTPAPSLKPSVPPTAPVAPSAPAAPPVRSSLAGIRLRLLSGAVLTLPTAAQAIIGRADPVSNFYPDIDLTAYGGLEHGVGRRHGRFIIQQGLVYYEDLDSTNGSFRNGIKLPPRQPQPLQHGDELRLGKLSLVIEIP
ncbi:MAG: zinc ribbon domain-containing protein [Chloroflexus sp.]|nr:zinc ribbon domain-containing protein [Chloroflexus sp.]